MKSDTVTTIRKYRLCSVHMVWLKIYLEQMRAQ